MNTDELTLDSTYDPKSDPAIRDRCTALGVLIDTMTPGYDPLRVAAQVAVRQALLAHLGR